MRYTIINKLFNATFDTKGAELVSLWRSDGFEYIWNGEEWKDHAPVLFPICGRLHDGKYSYDGKEYEMLIHGIAKYTEFKVVDYSTSSIVFELTESEELKAIFADVLGEAVTLKFDALKDTSVPAILNVSEESRRMEEMMKMYNMGDASGMTESTLVLNTSSALVAKLKDVAVSEPEKAKQMASYIYKLSLLSQKKFSADEMQGFMKDSFDILMKL